VFDVTILKTFENLENWRSEFLVQANVADHDKYPFILLGNKIDMEGQRVVSGGEIFLLLSTLLNSFLLLIFCSDCVVSGEPQASHAVV
jgi:Ras-related protein Rab-7A